MIQANSLTSHKKWFQLLDKIREFQVYLAGKPEPKKPFFVCGDEFLIWYIRDYHFHPLSGTFPDGFLLIHLSPTVVNKEKKTECVEKDGNDESGNTTCLQKESSVLSPSNLIDNDDSELLQFISDNYLISLQDKKISPLVSSCDITSLKPTQPAIELSGEDLSSPAALGGLVFREFKTLETIPDETSPKDTMTNSTYYNDSMEDTYSKPYHQTAQTKPFFKYALLERQLIPMSLPDASLFFLLAHRYLSVNKLTLFLPIVVMVNDNSPDVCNWDLLQHDINEAEEFENEIPMSPRSAWPPTENDPPQDSALDITPAPVRSSHNSIDYNSNLKQFVNDDPLLKQTDNHMKENISENNDSESSYDVSQMGITKNFNWSVFSRMRYICLYDTNTHLGHNISTMGQYSHIGRNTVGGSSIDFSTSNALKGTENQSSLQIKRYQLLTIKIPVLPQDHFLHGLSLHDFPIKTNNSMSCFPNEHSGLSIGKFLYNILPEKLLLRAYQLKKKNGLLINDLRDNLMESCLQDSIKLYGHPTAITRFDIVKGIFFNEPKFIEEGQIKEFFLNKRATVSEVAVCPGPLVSLMASWSITDVWGTTIFPSFPKPDLTATNLQMPEASITFRTGAGKESYLFWLWTDICLLEKLRTIRLAVSNLSHQANYNFLNESCKGESEDFSCISELQQKELLSHMMVPLHPKEECELRDTLNEFYSTNKYLNDNNRQQYQPVSSISSNTIPGHNCSRSKYQTLPEGQLVLEVPAFIEIERRLGQGTVRRRVGTPAVQTNSSLTPNHWNSVGNDLRHRRHENGTLDTQENDYLGQDVVHQSQQGSINHSEDMMWSMISLCPAPRNDSDFTDRLWQFIRRGWNAKDIYDSMQLIFDSIGTTFVGKQQNITSVVSQLTTIHSTERQSLLAVDSHTSLPVTQPLLPSLRKGASSKLASFIRLAIRVSQLRQYNQRRIGVTRVVGNDTTETQESDESELKNLQDEWHRLRDYYREPAICIDHVHEIATEALFRDAVGIIQQADPSIPVTNLEWFSENEHPIPVVLARLSRLHKIAELAALSRAAHLPWDPTRALLRQALDSFRSITIPDSPGHHPLFVVGLSRQAFRTLFTYWTRRETEAMFKLRFGNVLEALFLQNNGDTELSQLRRSYDIYPRNMGFTQYQLQEKNITEDELEDMSQHPLYIWKAFIKENDSATTNAVKTDNPREVQTQKASAVAPNDIAPAITITNADSCNSNVGLHSSFLTYSLQLIYGEPAF